MIQLVYQNECAMVYNIEDWEILRTKHRIIGDYLSSTQYVPALPLKLLPEEAALLLNKNIARLESYEYKEPTKEEAEEYHNMQHSLLEHERVVYKKIRRKQIECYIDKIVEGKRKRGDERDKEEILKEEVEKNEEIVNSDNMIWPVLLQSRRQGSATAIPSDAIVKSTNRIKCAVFEDLWSKGYYITSGYKFGGDFLLYKGDPLVYHAVYIVHCIEDKAETFSPREVVALGRLGSSVKKKPVLAVLDGDVVNYIAVTWMDSV